MGKKRRIQQHHPCKCTGVCSLVERSPHSGISCCCTRMFFHLTLLILRNREERVEILTKSIQKKYVIKYRKQHRSHSTSTDALNRAMSPSKVALQSLCVVTWLCFAAILKELLRTNFTASTAIQHKADTCCTSGGVQGTLTVLRA